MFIGKICLCEMSSHAGLDPDDKGHELNSRLQVKGGSHNQLGISNAQRDGSKKEKKKKSFACLPIYDCCEFEALRSKETKHI